MPDGLMGLIQGLLEIQWNQLQVEPVKIGLRKACEKTVHGVLSALGQKRSTDGTGESVHRKVMIL